MAKCDLFIELDNAGHDRVYHGGDTISGQVTVQVDQTVRCEWLKIEHQWRTHGRGNRTSGSVGETIAFAGEWQPGTYHYPFQFTAPHSPVTYRGKLLNIDHYIQARASVPWAFDPKAELDIILMPSLAGAPGDGYEDHGGVVTQGTKPNGCALGIGIALSVAGLFLLAAFPIGCFVLPIGLVVLAGSLWKTVAAKKVGDVRVEWPRVVASPGESMPVTVSFLPRRGVTLNGVTVKLVGQEVVVSGSGTNKTTHRHKVFEGLIPLCGSEHHQANRPVHLEGQVRIPPETTAYSFTAPSNSIKWTAETRIDIPSWPDWSEEHTLHVVPGREASGTPYATGPAFDVERIEVLEPIDDPPASEQIQPIEPIQPIEQPKQEAAKPSSLMEPQVAAPSLPEVESGQDAGADVAGEEPAAEPAAPAFTGSTYDENSLKHAIASVAAADRFSGERDRVMKDLADQAFAFDMQVDKVDWSMSFNIPEEYRSGRTVVGKLADGSAVAARFAKADNDTIDALKPGAKVSVKGRLAEWNNFYDRAELDVLGYERA